jgi:hypothetical protein
MLAFILGFILGIFVGAFAAAQGIKEGEIVPNTADGYTSSPNDTDEFGI